MDNFSLIVITTPDVYPDEARHITAMLRAGIDRVHIRKPDWSRAMVLDLVSAIPDELRGRLTLHDAFDIAAETGIGGLQLNSRHTDVPEGKFILSRSCHTLAEVKASERYDYVTLSPIFDSISKQGYLSAFEPENLRDNLSSLPVKVVALGGITPSHINILKSCGFSGAALLGYIWNNNPGTAVERLLGFR